MDAEELARKVFDDLQELILDQEGVSPISGKDVIPKVTQAIQKATAAKDKELVERNEAIEELCKRLSLMNGVVMPGPFSDSIKQDTLDLIDRIRLKQ